VIVRTTDTILVTEEELAQAISLVESTCREFGVSPEIEVTLYVDPEDETEQATTCIVAHVRQSPGMGRFGEMVVAVAQKLTAAGLLEPASPLSYHLRPEW
jgi:hypothetical protein